MLGGLWGRTRDLMTEGDYGAFEQTLERLFGEAIRANEELGRDLWSALANVDWYGPNGEEVGYSFRAGGDLVAALRREGDYMDWYCSGDYATVAEWIEEGMAREGWQYEVL